MCKFSSSWNDFQIAISYYRIVLPMGTRSSSPENWGWAVTQRRCLTILVQAPTPTRCYWIDLHCSFTRASSFFSQTRPAHQYRKQYLARNAPTWSLVAKASQHSSLAVREFRTASEEHCGQCYDWCGQTLLPDVVAPETHQNDHSYSLCELKLWTSGSPRKKFVCWQLHGGPWKTTELLKKYRVGPLLGDGHLHRIIR